MKDLDKKEFEKIIRRASFIKIAAYTSIDNIETSMEVLMQQFRFLIEIVKEDQ